MGYYTDTSLSLRRRSLYDIIDGGRYDRLSSRFGVDRPACGFGMNINLLYEYMNDAGLLEDTEPSFQLAVSYTTTDQPLIRDLMNWRSKGSALRLILIRRLSTVLITAFMPYTATARTIKTASA